MNFNGKHISFSFSGESHSPEIKLSICGIDKKDISVDYIKKQLKRRNPGLFFNSQRNEEDEFVILNNKIENNQICVVFKNTNFEKKDYNDNEGFLRPSHSDYTQLLTKGFVSSGGGEFSGRMTLPMVFVGSIAKHLLEKKNIFILSRIRSLGEIEEKNNDYCLENYKNKTEENPFFPTLSNKFKESCFNLLKQTKENKDSLGGVVETVIFNSPCAIGGVFDDSLESQISKMIFSIPGVKGVSFGDGFDITTKKGSESMDAFVLDNKTIKTKENHNGGINGGFTNGMPIIVNTAIKPTPTIKKPIKSLNYLTNKEQTVEFKGNYDVCFVNRAIPAIEGLVALVLLDLLYDKEKKQK